MLNRSEAIEWLQGGKLRFEPFDVRFSVLEPDKARGRPDWLVTLEWQGTMRRFVVEFKRQSTPRQLESAIAEVLAYAENDLPMVMLPYLGKEALDRLVEESVSGIDFSGNGVVIVPGKWLVMRTGGRNRFKASAPIKAVYRGTSSLVGRVLLLKPEFPRIGDIREEILTRGGRISWGTVSKVIKALEEELLVSRAPCIRAIQPDGLLEKLTASYSKPKIGESVKARLGRDSNTLRRIAMKADSEGVMIAGNGERSYAVSPGTDRILTIYTDSISTVLDGLDLELGSPFSDAEFIETSDQLAFFDRRRREEFWWTSPIQVYLELASGGKREREISSQMRSDILEFRYT